MHVGGRGRAGYTMMLPIEQNWIVQTVAVPTCNQSGCTYYESNYRYIANPIWWTGIQPGFGPGVLQGRQSGSDETTVIGCAGPFFTRTLTRLTFTAPDGTPGCSASGVQPAVAVVFAGGVDCANAVANDVRIRIKITGKL